MPRPPYPDLATLIGKVLSEGDLDEALAYGLTARYVPAGTQHDELRAAWRELDAARVAYVTARDRVEDLLGLSELC